MARLAAYQKEFGADWDLWTGTPAQIAAFWKPFGVEYQIVPEEQPPKTDWCTGQPLTYDVDHTDGYILIDPAGRERFVDATAPNLERQARPQADLPARRRRRARPAAPAAAQLDDRRRARVHQLGSRHQRARVGLVMRAGLRRPAHVVPAASSASPWRSRACANSDVTTLSAPPTTDTSLTLTLQHSPVGPILATGGGNTLYDFVPDTPTHSACVNDGCVLQWPPLFKSGPVRVGKGVDPSLVGDAARGPTGRPSSPTAATRSTPTTWTSRRGW